VLLTKIERLDPAALDLPQATAADLLARLIRHTTGPLRMGLTAPRGASVTPYKKRGGHG